MCKQWQDRRRMVESRADNVLSNHVTSGKDLSLRYTMCKRWQERRRMVESRADNV